MLYEVIRSIKKLIDQLQAVESLINYIRKLARITIKDASHTWYGRYLSADFTFKRTW